jgi:hypothetical protein
MHRVLASTGNLAEVALLQNLPACTLSHSLKVVGTVCMVDDDSMGNSLGEWVVTRISGTKSLTQI